MILWATVVVIVVFDVVSDVVVVVFVVNVVVILLIVVASKLKISCIYVAFKLHHSSKPLCLALLLIK